MTTTEAARPQATPYLHTEGGAPHDAGTFHLGEYVTRVDPRLLGSPEGRRALTRLDPLLWATLYVPHLLKDHEGTVTFGDVHLTIYRDALELVRTPGPKESRRAYVAPRGSGKSTSLFLITPLWAACHGHVNFVAAFSSSATQAQDHLAGLRRELQTNKLLRLDYPDLCEPARKKNGTPVADSQALLFTKSSFSFAARGIDTEVLGLVDPENRRPDMLLLDDIEGEEGAGYSQYQAKKRLTTLLDGVLPMNDRAHVRLVGTVNLPGGILDQLTKSATETGDPERWIADERFNVTYFPPLVPLGDGTERSLWPGRWSTEYLQSISSTRSYMKNFANKPVPEDAEYWSPSDFTYEQPPVVRAYLSVDGAVTTKKSSDFTGLSVVGVADGAAGGPARCVVEHAEAVKLQGAALRARVVQLLESFPHVGAVLVETNQGGDMWREVLAGLPVRIITVHNSEPKTVRAGRLLNLYQAVPPRVVHARPLRALEEQMCAFPKALNDDLVDSVGNAVLRFLKPPPRKRAAARSVTPR
jgi:phage terminase large subunit-like protein